MSADFASHPAVKEEQVLTRVLSSGQQAMIAIGGAIGTGLFLASGAAVPAAGPGVIFSTLLVAATLVPVLCLLPVLNTREVGRLLARRAAAEAPGEKGYR